jgi:hypothetical protein
MCPERTGGFLAGAGGFEPPHGGIKIRYLADIPCSGTGRCIAIAARHRPNHSQRFVAPSGGTGFCAIQMRSRPIHEPEGKLLGTAPHGELLWNHENRTCSPGPISNTRCCPARPVLLHRRILQSSAAPFRPWVHRPRTGRAPSRLIRCPLNCRKVIRYRSRFARRRRTAYSVPRRRGADHS